MLGVKSNRESIKGAFAKKLREELAAACKEQKTSKDNIRVKASDVKKD